MVNKLPQLNEQQLTLGVSRLSDLYHKLTLDLFDQVVDRLTERGTTSLEENPYIWQLEKMSNMGLLNDENIRLIAERSQIAEELIREVISGEGYKIYQDTRQHLAESMGRSLPNGGNQVFDRLESLVNQTIYDMDNLVNTTLPKSVQNVYKSAIEETVAKVVIGVSTPKEALSETLMKWHEKGFYGFTDKAGRSWRADSYARTVIQSTTYRAYNEARMAPAKELGVDTYYYSVKSAAREMCAPLQHQIVTTGEARTEEGVRLLALSDYGYGTPGGCLGINCAHTLTPFLPGINEKPDLPPWLENLTPEQAIENANVQAKQRALEREIRRNKERLHVAEKLGDQELVQKYQLKGKTLDSAMKDWVGKHSFLYRDKVREKYVENSKSFDKQEKLIKTYISKTESQYKDMVNLLGKDRMPSMEEFKNMRYNNTNQYRELVESARWKNATFPSEKSFTGHFRKHRDEFNGFSMEDYQAHASDLLSRPIGEGVEGYDTPTRRVRYDTENNIFVAGDVRRKTIKTMMKPEKGARYYEEDKEREFNTD